MGKAMCLPRTEYETNVGSTCGYGDGDLPTRFRVFHPIASGGMHFSKVIFAGHCRETPHH